MIVDFRLTVAKIVSESLAWISAGRKTNDALKPTFGNSMEWIQQLESWEAGETAICRGDRSAVFDCQRRQMGIHHQFS